MLNREGGRRGPGAGMGIHDRDYYRDGSRGLFDAWGRQGVTGWLIAVTCAVWLVQLATLGPFGVGGLTDAALYDTDRILEGEVWRLFTSVFLHAVPFNRGLFHLLFNMLALYWAGTRLEARYGGREFLAFYLLGGVFAGAFSLALEAAGVVPPSRALGASGAVTAVLILFALNYPRQQVLLFFAIPMPVWLVVVLYVGLDVFGAFGFGRGGIAYVVHLGGALFGLLYYQAGIRIASFPAWPARPRRAAAPRLRVVPVDPAEVEERTATPQPAAEAGFDARVDAVLAKVSTLGQESLTAEEREILFRAGELYKKRRK